MQQNPLPLENELDLPEAPEALLTIAQELVRVLELRTHRKKVLGQYYNIPGQLPQALGLPVIIEKLASRQAQRRLSGQEQFRDLWVTLSSATRRRVLQEVGWYDPGDLDWDDKRSNRRPKILD
jgi:hypothetical protein